MTPHKPILFSTAMVQAILNGNKTITRRLVKPQPRLQGDGARTISIERISDEGDFVDYDGKIFKFPYGKVGDLLWVKETHYAFGTWKVNGTTKKGKLKYRFKLQDDESIDFDKEVKIMKETYTLDVQPNSNKLGANWYKRSSLFLQKKHARIWLKIEEIRVERLQEISEEDARAEGVEFIEHYETKKPFFKDYSYYTDCPLSDCGGFYQAKHSFQSLWRIINGKESWKANPWVWVIKFSRTARPAMSEVSIPIKIVAKKIEP